MLQHQAAQVEKGAPLSRIQLNLGFTPLGLTPKQSVGLVGRNFVEEFEVIQSEASPQLGAGGEGSRRMGEESSREKPNLGSGVCTASTTQKVSKLQYRQVVQGEAHSLGGEGGRMEGEVAGIVATLSPASVGTQRVGSLTHPMIAETKNQNLDFPTGVSICVCLCARPQLLSFSYSIAD